MMQHEESRERDQIPCLGGIPILGAGFSNKINTDSKRNLLMFIRPIIIDTEEEIQNISKRQQDIYDYKDCLEKYDEYEVVEALDLFNVRKTLHPEDDPQCAECK
jgi:type III secretion protein C